MVKLFTEITLFKIHMKERSGIPRSGSGAVNVERSESVFDRQKQIIELSRAMLNSIICFWSGLDYIFAV